MELNERDTDESDLLPDYMATTKTNLRARSNPDQSEGVEVHIFFKGHDGSQDADSSSLV